jgi:hypothetical protein
MGDPDGDAESLQRLAELTYPMGQWFGKLYAAETFDFGANVAFIREGKELMRQSLRLRGPPFAPTGLLAPEITTNNPKLRFEQLFLELYPFGKFHSPRPYASVALWSMSVDTVINLHIWSDRM